MNVNKKAIELPLIKVHNNMTVAELGEALGKGTGKRYMVSAFSRLEYSFTFRVLY